MQLRLATHYHNINNNLNHTKNNSPFMEVIRKRDDSTHKSYVTYDYYMTCDSEKNWKIFQVFRILFGMFDVLLISEICNYLFYTLAVGMTMRIINYLFSHMMSKFSSVMRSNKKCWIIISHQQTLNSIQVERTFEFNILMLLWNLSIFKLSFHMVITCEYVTWCCCVHWNFIYHLHWLCLFNFYTKIPTIENGNF